jgi:tetratricopeptide (TPR) repeat protein
LHPKSTVGETDPPNINCWQSIVQKDVFFNIDQMKKLFFLSFIFTACSALTPLQKGRLISLFHLIETAKYEEAKEVAEEMIEGDESSQWANTWYARGLLCQNAYTEGKKKNDAKLFELYPDQLYVAFESYEKARHLDNKGRMDRQLAPKYVHLANEFQSIGVNHFDSKNFNASLRAFDQALMIKSNPILTVQTDTLLIYNTALAAYQSKEWDEALEHLSKMHEYRYSANVTHLYFETALTTGDTTLAKQVLFEGVIFFDYDETLTLLLSEFLLAREDRDSALQLIENAIIKYPENQNFHYTKGLIHQKSETYDLAIEAYQNAIELACDDVMLYINIATCYFNKGVEREDVARSLNSNSAVMEERAKSAEAFNEALMWLDKASQQQPEDQTIVNRLSELYTRLRETEKAGMIEEKID